MYVVTLKFLYNAVSSSYVEFSPLHYSLYFESSSSFYSQVCVTSFPACCCILILLVDIFHFASYSKHSSLRHVHNSAPVVPTFSWINQVHILPPYLISILILPCLCAYAVQIGKLHIHCITRNRIFDINQKNINTTSSSVILVFYVSLLLLPKSRSW